MAPYGVLVNSMVASLWCMEFSEDVEILSIERSKKNYRGSILIMAISDVETITE